MAVSNTDLVASLDGAEENNEVSQIVDAYEGDSFEVLASAINVQQPPGKGICGIADLLVGHIDEAF